MKIGILGCGYVGKAAAQHFMQKEGVEVVVTTRQPERVTELQSISTKVCLIQHPKDYREFLHDLNVLFITVAPDSMADYQETYLGTAIIITELLPHSPRLQQIIYTSSTSVYGEHQGNWVSEVTPCTPLNANSQILLETENQLLTNWTANLNICIFRLGEIIGPNRSIVERLKNSPNKVYAGDGSQYSNLVQLTDIIQACELAIDHQLSGIYNLCNDFHLTRKVLYEQICQKFDLPPIQWDKNLKSMHGGNKRISSEKIKKMNFCFLEFNSNNLYPFTG